MLFVAALLLGADALNLRKKHQHHIRHHGHSQNKSAVALFGAVSGKMHLDPHCHEGIMNTEMTVCCQGDCGECHDGAAQCDGRVTGTGRASTCCPATIISDEAPSCEISKAPCMVPDYVRNPETQTFGDRHAKDDCNKVIPDTDAANHLATHYLKFEGKTLSLTAASKVCSPTYGKLAQIAAACSNDDECMAFSADGSDSPKCIFKAGTEIEELSSSSDNLYLKRETLAGETFQFGNPQYGACSASCDGGILVPIYECTNTAGVTVKAGMCTNLAAMNEDAVPHVEIECNTEECPEIEHPLGDDCVNEFLGCVEVPDKGVTYAYYGPDVHPMYTICPSSLRIRKPWTWNRYLGFNYYYHEQEDGDYVRVPADGTIVYDDAWYYWGHGIVPPSYVRFECGEAGNEQYVPTESREPYSFEYYGTTYYYYALQETHGVLLHPCACAKKKK